MNSILPAHYIQSLEILDFAFQPIVNINNGEIYAVEALLRNYKEIGFKSIFSLFDTLFEEGLLYSFDIILREKAFIKFATIPNNQNIKLFYNLDNRILEMENYSNGNTLRLLHRLGLQKEQLCFEISERHEVSTNIGMEKILKYYKNDGFHIAIDDFGTGYSGYKLLYNTTPNIIKIDRYFIQNIEQDLKKKILLKSIINLSLQLGIKVLAEGVETEEEYLVCQEVGCHFIQGYYLQRPTIHITNLQNNYKHLYKRPMRDKTNNIQFIQYADNIMPLSYKTEMQDVIAYFKKHPHIKSIPIVNDTMEPLGVLYEDDLKEFIYSTYGLSLLSNKSSKHSQITNYIQYCGSAEITSSISQIIEIFSNNEVSIGIILTKDTKYYGFLSSSSIINILNTENVLIAQDQNPLTKLPGNRIIDQYLQTVTHDLQEYTICYFDLDNFKAYNDVYGFRNGDRVIQLFADLLKTELSNEYFKAHIGGDDFVCAIPSQEFFAIQDIKSITQHFKNNAREFYSQEDKENNYIIATDRTAKTKKFPLVTVSASIVIVNSKTKDRSLKTINKILAEQKKVAKNDTNHLAISAIL